MQFREIDERDRLVGISVLVRNEAKYAELESADDDKLAPRPYITAAGGILFFLGMFFTWLPLCDIIGLIFPGTECRALAWISLLRVVKPTNAEQRCL